MAGGWGAKIFGADAVIDGLQAMVGDVAASKTVVAGQEYAVYVEFGTSTMPANGALRASIQQTMSQLDKFSNRANSVNELIDLLAEDIADGYRQDVWVDTGALRDSIRVERA